MDYSSYKDLKVRLLEPGILEITMGEEGKLAVATENAHAEMARIWLDVDRDPQARVAILRGAGKGFSAGGDLAMVEKMTQDFDLRARVWREARDLVYNMINCSKIIVSAMHGPAVGAGLVAGLLADISICALDARLGDGHVRLGVAAGDHAAITPCSVANMKRAAPIRAPFFTTKASEPLNTMPVGLPPVVIVGDGISTTSDCTTPLPSYSVDFIPSAEDTHTPTMGDHLPGPPESHQQ